MALRERNERLIEENRLLEERLQSNVSKNLNELNSELIQELLIIFNQINT